MLGPVGRSTFSRNKEPQRLLTFTIVFPYDRPRANLISVFQNGQYNIHLKRKHELEVHVQFDIHFKLNTKIKHVHQHICVINSKTLFIKNATRQNLNHEDLFNK